MTHDPTEATRRAMLASGQPAEDLQTATQTWDSDQLRAEFQVIGFQAPFVIVQRKSDGAVGSLEFTHSPRVYFNWHEDQKP